MTNQLNIELTLCILYYLKDESGIRAMPHHEFYNSKPANLERVAYDRVWRYVITDHASGAFYVEYVMGAGIDHNLCKFFIHAMQQPAPVDPLLGEPLFGKLDEPFMVVLDPGTANSADAFKNLCLSLGIELQVKKPGQPWAKGLIEQANNLIEKDFEAGLKFFNIQSLEALNSKCRHWLTYVNETLTSGAQVLDQE